MQRQGLGTNPFVTAWDYWSDLLTDNNAWNHQFNVPQRELDKVAADHAVDFYKATNGKASESRIAQEQSAYKRNVGSLGKEFEKDREHMNLAIVAGAGLFGLAVIAITMRRS